MGLTTMLEERDGRSARAAAEHKQRDPSLAVGHRPLLRTPSDTRRRSAPPDLGTYREARTSAEDEERFLPAGPTAANAHATRETSAKMNLVGFKGTVWPRNGRAAASVTYIC